MGGRASASSAVTGDTRLTALPENLLPGDSGEESGSYPGLPHPLPIGDGGKTEQHMVGHVAHGRSAASNRLVAH